MILIQCLIFIIATNAQTWSDVTNLLNNGIQSKIYPGYTSIVGYRNGTKLFESFGGKFVYNGDKPPPFDNGINPSMSINTHFDMASITKLMSTTSSTLKLLENKSYINSLLDPITKYLGLGFAVHNKSSIKIINCLLHNAGFYPDPVPNWFNTPAFGCPQSTEYTPMLTFNCTQAIYNNTIAQPLDYNTGTKMIYSDLSMMTMSFVIGQIVKNNNIIKQSDLLSTCFDYSNIEAPLICYFEAYVRIHLFSALNMTNTGFLPSLHQNIQPQCAPTCNSTTTFNHEILQGIVQDPNSFANGGVFGHAGLFSTVPDVYKWSQNILNSAYNAIPIFNYTYPYIDNLETNNDATDYFSDMKLYFDPQWTNLFLSEYDHSLSSRALGFDTNDYSITDYGGSHVCGDFIHGSFETVAEHTGYTGTLFCLDRERDLIYLLLTNRVYPDPYASTKITTQRRAFSNLVLSIIDSDLFYADEKRKFAPLYKQCNNTWRNDMMNTDSLCNSWLGGSFVASLAMGLNTFGIILNKNEKIDPSSLNEWIIEQKGYNNSNELIDRAIIENINKDKIKYVGSFSELSLSELKTYINDTNIVIGQSMRHINQQQYKYNLNISRYVNFIGYSTQQFDTFIARDPFLYQMRFAYANITGDFAIYSIL
eukprot:250291_1